MTFQEAVDYFKERVPVTAEQFYRIAEHYRSLAFTVSGYTKAHILKRFYEELLSALEEGGTLGEFRANMNGFLESEGYEGHDAHPGRPDLPHQCADGLQRGPLRADERSGRHAAASLLAVRRGQRHPYPAEPSGDGRQGLSGGFPVWDTWFPPNGFRCRCTVRSLSRRQVEQRGLTVETEAPPIQPDPQFSTNPAKVRFEPDLKDYPEPLVKAYRAREKEGGGA